MGLRPPVSVSGLRVVPGLPGHVRGRHDPAVALIQKPPFFPDFSCQRGFLVIYFFPRIFLSAASRVASGGGVFNFRKNFIRFRGVIFRPLCYAPLRKEVEQMKSKPELKFESAVDQILNWSTIDAGTREVLRRLMAEVAAFVHESSSK